jgi:CubicO group peptidase (beta-lactamase class C family)
MTRILKFLNATIAIAICSHVYADTDTTVSPCAPESIDIWLNANHVPAVGIGVIEDGRIKSINVYGELRQGVPAPAEAIWNVASLTKPITALTVLELVNKGELNLDEPLSKYWIDPDLRGNPWVEKLTARILLSHQSGFPNWRWNDSSKKLSFHFEPGTKMGYSGEGYEYLRRAVENKFGQSLEEIAERVVFGPIGMKDTQYAWSSKLNEARFADPHDNKGLIIAKSKSTDICAADWLVTTVGDYCKFGVSVINGAGLTPDLYKQMIKIQSHFDSKPEHGSTGMGLGWQVIDNMPNGEYALTHSGSDDGVQTVVLLLPKSKRGIVIFTNGDDGYKVESQILKNSFPALRPDLEKYLGI